MAVRSRRVWRAAPATMVIVVAFVVLAGVAIPSLAYLIWNREQEPLLPALLGGLTLAALLYAWRFGLHPRLVATESGLLVVNPFRKHRIEWDDLTLVVPGENGLVLGTDETQVEVWCIQKSNHATKHARTTRSDTVTGEVMDLWDVADPPLEDAQTGLRIRRARPDESHLLTRMERAAAEASFAHVFDPAEHRYPVNDVRRRWRRLLRDRTVRTRVLELFDAPVGFVAFTADTVRHLSVVPQHTRRGYGSALLEYASREMFDNGAREAFLWVLTDNESGRDFYAFHGWVDTDEVRDSEFPPHPEERRLRKANPAAPRRRAL